MTAWLHIIGIGEDGIDGLSATARDLIANAEVILGGDRHHALIPDLKAQRIAWPSPFDAMIDTIKAQKGKRFVILVTGDPLWYSVGARILKSIPADQVTFHPQLSAFQWGAARMGWSLADLETVTIHGRAAAQIIPFFAPGARILALTKDRTSPPAVAELLTARGYGPSKMSVWSALGGPREARFDGTAQDWGPQVPDFHLLAIDCIAAPDARPLPRGPGLPDEAFVHDGKMTKSEIRAITLARLAPQRGAMLWDLGCGCGSIAIEWLRATRDAEATGVDTRADRLEMARQNALNLGAPRLKLIEGESLAALPDLPAPDAIFIGGGLNAELVDRCLTALKPHGRLVVNAVTLESEAMLSDLHARHGGSLIRLSVARAIPVGSLRGWKPAMPVTQWVWS